MKNIIIGTAGHVDHGKTQLTKALSGIDTDRLAEEQKRGITIELGFAHIPNDEGYNIGVIDVPGHEKFIKNMLAGIGGIDFVIFVVAADEGIMPQTREHFEILKALGIEDGIVAVTKTDMVDDEWLEMLLEEVEDYFKGSFLEGKPIVPVSARTGDNIDVLKAEILKKCDRENKRTEEKELFRLPVDRVFTMSGFGTVVTGTLIDGKCQVGDEILICPEGMKAKIRGIQTYGKDTDVAIAGQRTAINLSGVKKEDIGRGDVLSMPGAATVTSMIDVVLSAFDSCDKLILNNSRVHVYTGSKESLAKVILLDRDALAGGETCYAQLRLEEPIAVRRGDRFIVRFYSPMITIAGGRIIDAAPDKHKRNREDVLSSLEVLENGTIEEVVRQKTGGRHFYKEAELASDVGIIRCTFDEILAAELERGDIIRLAEGSLISRDKASALGRGVTELLEAYHESNPLADGMPKQELLSRLRERWHIEDDKLVAALLQDAIDKGAAADNGKSVSLAGHSVSFSDEQLALMERIAGMYEKADIELLKNDDVYALSSDRNEIAALLSELVSQERIVKVDASYYASKAAWDTAVDAAFSLGANFSLADYRDKLDTSRKYASIFLTAFDRAGITMFAGEARTAVARR